LSLDDGRHINGQFLFYFLQLKAIILSALNVLHIKWRGTQKNSKNRHSESKRNKMEPEQRCHSESYPPILLEIYTITTHGSFFKNNYKRKKEKNLALQIVYRVIFNI